MPGRVEPKVWAKDRMDDDHLKEKERIDLVVEETETSDSILETLMLKEHGQNSLFEAPVEPLLGALIGGMYRVDECIGRGGMGQVYKARDLSLDRWVAIKVLTKNLIAETLQRFQQEGRVLSQVVHPHIAAVHGIGMTDDGRPYIVMEFVDGVPLSKIIREEAPINPDWIVNIVNQVLAALEPLHKAGIVHRDLKPDNILIAPNASGVDHVKLVDFGIAKNMTEGQDLTQPGLVVGTPSYLSPERVLTQDVDARADIYSLGCILFEMLTGHPPYQGESRFEIMRKHADDPIPKLPNEFKGLQKCFEKSVAKKPEDRYQNAMDFSKELLGAFLFNWRRMLLMPPAKVPAVMHMRKRPLGLEKDMILFWSSILAIIFLSLLSLIVPSVKFIAFWLIGAAAILFFVQLNRAFGAPKDTKM